MDVQGRVTRSCSRFPRPVHFYAHILGLNRLFPRQFQNNFMSEWDHSETRQVDVVTGAFLLVRRAVFEAVGGFDERFFVYLEDVDFLHAIRKAGWQSWYFASARAYHKGGGCSKQARAARLFYSLQSRILYSFKHFGWAAATGILLSTVLVEPFSRLAWAAWRRSAGEMLDTLRGFAMIWGRVPGFVAQRLPFSRGGLVK